LFGGSSGTGIEDYQRLSHFTAGVSAAVVTTMATDRSTPGVKLDRSKLIFLERKLLGVDDDAGPFGVRRS